MTKLVWDKPGQRLFQAGLDRGVLYLSTSLGVAWNGLTSVDEDLEDTTSEPVFFDGTKIGETPLFGDFAATLHAFTYPDEFLEYEGIIPTGDGFFVDAQTPKQFGLTYRTRVGNDVDGTDLGYLIHIIYNLTAVADTKSYVTQQPGSGPMDFAWKLTAVPENIPGFRPTAHVILDSRFLPADILRTIEDILYGSDGGTTGSPVYDGGYADAGFDVIDGGYPYYTSPDEIDFNDDEHVDVDGNEIYLVYRETIDGGYAGAMGDELSDGSYDPSDARLPPIDELIGLIGLWGPRIIIPHSVTGLAQLFPGVGDVTQTVVPGIYTALPENRLEETAVPGIYILT